MTVFEFDGIKLEMIFNLDAWEQIEADVMPLHDMFSMYKNERDAMMADTMHKTMMIAVIMAKAAGSTSVTYEELRKKLSPGGVILLERTIMKAVGDGLSTQQNHKGKRDLVLEELDAKEGKNS